MSVLEILEDKRVCRFEKQKDGTYEAYELCDEVYGVMLTKEQMIKLAEEIITLANS